MLGKFCRMLSFSCSWLSKTVGLCQRDNIQVTLKHVLVERLPFASHPRPGGVNKTTSAAGSEFVFH